MNELFEIQQKLKVPKNQDNEFGGFKFRSCEDILEAVKPILKEFECMLILKDEIVNKGDRYYVEATAFLYNKENKVIAENTASARESDKKKGMDEAQITGAASSYARKYCLNGLFLLDDTKDSDTNEHATELENTPEETITDEQLINLEEICQSKNFPPAETLLRMATKVFNIKKIELLPKSEFKKAQNALDNKPANKKAD